ncbi:MAG: ABC transporter substrate-binding protein [Halorientalis sp.]
MPDTELSVSVKNTAEDPQQGRTKYQELVTGENVDVTTGVFTSEVLIGLMDPIARAETVHLTTGAATPQVSRQISNNYDRYKYHFRTGPINAHHLGENMVDFAEAKFGDLGWDSVAVLVEDYTWTEPVQEVLDAQLADAGVEVAMRRRYASGTQNFGPIYDAVEESGADAAYVAMAHTGTPAVVQWARDQRPFEFGGIHVLTQLPSYYQATGGACRYVVSQNSATPQSEVTSKTVPFSNAYQSAYGSYPVYTGYITFDAVKQWATVATEQGSLDSDTMVSGLEESSYTGTAGTIQYYGPDQEFTHDVVYDRDLVWPLYQQWQAEDGEGVQEVIYPDNLATAEYQAPPWV